MSAELNEPRAVTSLTDPELANQLEEIAANLEEPRHMVLYETVRRLRKSWQEQELHRQGVVTAHVDIMSEVLEPGSTQQEATDRLILMSARCERERTGGQRCLDDRWREAHTETWLANLADQPGEWCGWCQSVAEVVSRRGEGWPGKVKLSEHEPSVEDWKPGSHYGARWVCGFKSRTGEVCGRYVTRSDDGTWSHDAVEEEGR